MVQKKVVAVHDISCYGRCSLTVALPILSAAGINTPVIPTAVLSTYVGPFPGFTYRDMTEDIMPTVEHWKKMGFSFDAFYTGFLGSKDQIEVVRKAIRTVKGPDTKVYVDPVMADLGKLYPVFGEDFPAEMKKLCGDADIIIPNITELTLMLEKPYEEGPYTEEYIRGLLKDAESLGAEQIVLTGVYFTEGKLGAASYDCRTGKIRYTMRDRIPGSYHGTGDIFGSGLVSALTNGWELSEAVEIAVDLAVSAIKRTYEAGDDIKDGVNFEESLSGFGSRVKKVCSVSPVKTKKDAERIEKMASVIWESAYEGIISEEQRKYMLKKFLSADSVMKQISEGTVFEFLLQEGKEAGFVAYRKEGRKMFLSKMYVLKEYRHTGLSSFAFRRVSNVSEDAGTDSVYLTVNRKNTHAVSVYEKWGFVKKEEKVTDIGSGFVMDDYVMEFPLSAKKH